MKSLYSAGALIVLAVLFLVLTMLSGAALKGFRLDLTEHRLYTLSEGTRSILAGLDEPVTLRFYFSDAASGDLPQVRSFAGRVGELLDEMADRSGGRLVVRQIDPLPFSEDEDDADRFGLDAVPLGAGGEVLYMGIVGTNQLDGLEVISFLSPARERFLEYDLTRMILALGRPDPPRVGLISQLPLREGFDAQSGRERPAWAVYEQLSELFDMEIVGPAATRLPEGLDALVLVHPRDLDEALEYEIDQFALAGGRVLAFVDPYSEADPGPDPADPAARFLAERSSSLERILEAWGLSLEPDVFVADAARALQVTFETGQPPMLHPALLGVTRDDMSAEDVVTAGLDSVNFASAGHLEILPDRTTEIEALIRSSDRAGLLPVERLRMNVPPADLMDELGITGERHVLAARVSGRAESAFPGRDGTAHLDQGQVHAIVVADTDLLSDRLWVQRQSFLGSVLLSPFAGNGALAVNAVENLLGGAELIAVRSRATSSRPFNLVDDLRREAGERLRATERRIEEELQEAEERLTQLQRARGDADLTVLTPEQEAEIDRFMEQRMELRRQLRQVRRELDRDIDALGGRIKWINIGLMPLLVTTLALVMGWRRRRAQHAGAGSR